MKKDNYSFQTDRGTLKTATETTAHWITNKEATSTEASINIARPYVKSRILSPTATKISP